jgi:hypothetical protein
MPEFALTHSNDRARITTVIDDPALVQVRLYELHPDLQVKLLTDAIIGGLRWRNEATPASAPIAAGVQQWLKTVEDLRTLLASVHWHVHEQQNCPFISSPDRTVSIVVMTGSAETGRNGPDDPTNQAEKGAVAEGFVQTNSQLELFNQESVSLAKTHQRETQVWALLYHYDKGLNEVRFELSLPTGFNKKKITRWGERLILGSISNNPAEFTIRKDEPNVPVTVDVEPKPGLF